MSLQLILTVIIFLFIIVAAVIAFYTSKLKNEEFKRTGKHPEGHYMSIGIAIGIPLGIPVGLAMGNISLGIPIGLAIGAGIGASLEAKHKKELRPLTKKEREMKMRVMLFLIGMMLCGVIVFFITKFFYSNV